MMQGLKAKNEEEARLSRVLAIVHWLYQAAIKVAGTTTQTSFNYQIPAAHSLAGRSDPFYIKNMSDILKGLQDRFPDCVISHAVMTKGRDGKLYDISKIDDKSLQFVDVALDGSYIVIDWS